MLQATQSKRISHCRGREAFLWLSRDFDRQALETWRFDDKLRGRPAIFNPPVHHFKEQDMIPVVIRMERRVVRTSREKG